MAIEDVAAGMKPYARPFNLVPPPRDRQFRTAALKAERSKRKADRRLASALDEGEAEAVHAVNTAELTRLWSSAAYRDLRAGLPPQEEESFTVSWSASCPAKRRLRSGTRPLPPCVRLVAPPISLRTPGRASGGRAFQTSTGGERPRDRQVL